MAVAEANAKSWRGFLDDLTNGVALKDALFDNGVDPKQLELSVRTNAERQIEYEEARTAAMRATWTISELENVMDAIVLAEGDGSLGSILKKRKKDHVTFLRLVERDPHIGAMYAEAQVLWAERKIEDLTRLINGAGSQGDKRKFDMAKVLMASLSDKFKAARQAVTDKDSAAELVAKLEAGRKRVEDLWMEREAQGEMRFG